MKECDVFQNGSCTGGGDVTEVSVLYSEKSVSIHATNYLLVTLQLLKTRQEDPNVNIRVARYIMDMYGFNVTYSVVNVAADVDTNTCSVDRCSFLGHCYASADFKNYSCHCFLDFYGQTCQYGPKCNPRLENTPCRNGGKCRLVA